MHKVVIVKEPRRADSPKPLIDIEQKGATEPRRFSSSSVASFALEYQAPPSAPRIPKEAYPQFKEAIKKEYGRLATWEDNHQVNAGKVVEALKEVIAGHAKKGRAGMPNAHYKQAGRLILEALNIDESAWKAARKDIGTQGFYDLLDSVPANVLLNLGVAFAAMHSGPVGQYVLKYIATWAINAFSNSIFQIPLDAKQEVIATRHGRPAFTSELGSSTKLNTISAELKKAMHAIAAAQRKFDASEDPSEDRRDAINELTSGLADLQRLHLEYTRRIARGQGNIIKYLIQASTRAATAAPTIVGAIHAGPFAPLVLWASNILLYGPLSWAAYKDEQNLASHVVQSDVKYTNFFVADAQQDDGGRPRLSREKMHDGNVDITPEDIDVEVARKIWRSPRNVLHDNVKAIYTNELAELLRKIAKNEKHHRQLESRLKQVKTANTADTSRGIFKGLGTYRAKEKDLKTKLVNSERALNGYKADLETLKHDIVAFEQGMDALAERRHGAAMQGNDNAGTHWDKLSPDGIIARVMLDPSKQMRKLAKAKWKRPGEYSSQVTDRLAANIYARTAVNGMLDGLQHDGVITNHVEPFTYQSATTVGNSSLLRSVTVMFKQTVTRRQAAEASRKSVSRTSLSTAEHEVKRLNSRPSITRSLTSLSSALPNPIRRMSTGISESNRAIDATSPASGSQHKPSRRQSLAIGNDEGREKVIRTQLFGEGRIATGSPDWIAPEYEIRVADDEGIERVMRVNIENTRAYWKATHSAASSAWIGTKDALRSFGTQTKGLATLPWRFSRASYRDHQAKQKIAEVRGQLDDLERAATQPANTNVTNS